MKMINSLSLIFCEKIGNGIDPMSAFAEVINENFVDLYARDFIHEDTLNCIKNAKPYKESVMHKSFCTITEMIKKEKLYSFEAKMTGDEMETTYHVTVFRPYLT